MKPLGDRKRHYWLAKRMAKATGADIVGAHELGELRQEEWAEMIRNCRSCDWAEGCARWLQRNAAAETVPSECANCSRLAELQPMLSERV
ncbi:DUF6455 family protein [Thalassovita sp.]|uniref:DUF6455 family protein n=1 Tax=Thalassovita sp. TaxID=1979401 RepID=UPI00288264A1|nr:DUF6455 family protein [Thalassovita sp.]MDF1802979.1 DUF6455 family protein [Thalassovita sp.]